MTWPANKILRALASACAAITTKQIAVFTDLTIEQIWDGCETLVKNKLVTRKERGCYQITTAGAAAIAEGKEIKCGPKGPVGPKARRGTMRERLWQAIRKERKGTIGSFVSLVLQDGDDEKKVMENAQKFICVLCQAGYMTKLPGKQQGTALTSNGFARYILVVNNGPLAPVVRRIQRQIFDPNTNVTIELKEVAR